MIFSLAIAFAGACAELVKEDSGGFNFKGRSSCGKTTCLLIAVSVCGSPKFKKSWKSTSNAIEGICFLHNDNLLALDEFGQVDSKEAGNTAYMIAQGMGKNRQNSDSTQRRIKTWRTMLISTGEVGLAEHMQEKGMKTKAGQLVRFCDIPAEVEKGYGCFESIHGCDNGSDFATKIKVACESYYGTPIGEFVNVLSQEKDISTQFLKHAMEDFAADISRDFDGQVKRVARRFGLLYGAIWLAIRKDLLGSYLTEEDAKWAITTCFESWLNDRGTTGNFESKSIIENVIRLIRENSDSKFPDVNWKENSECGPRYAQIWGRKEGDIYYISCETFKKHFCEGENPKTVIKTLEEEGIIIRSENGKLSSAKRLLTGENKQVAKGYTLKISTMFTN
jgi:putative DNA primase/helicase